MNTRNAYHIQGLTDLQKIRNDAERRLLESPPQETTIHFHEHGWPCSDNKHEHIMIKDGYQ